MRIYYYEYSDDGGQTWFIGDCSNSIYTVLDKAYESSYKWRIKTTKVDTKSSELVSKEYINETREVQKVLEKIFQ